MYNGSKAREDFDESNYNYATLGYCRPIENDRELYNKMNQYAASAAEPASSASAPSASATSAKADTKGNEVPANIVVDTHNNPTLSRIVRDLAVKAGIKDLGFNDPWRYLWLIRKADNRASHGWGENTMCHSGSICNSHSDTPLFDAATQMGEIIRILETPIGPTAPKIHGYEATVDKDYVIFGCAKISRMMLEEVRKVIEPNWCGNRKIDSVTLDSGKTLTKAQIAEILDYVKAMDSGGAK